MAEHTPIPWSVDKDGDILAPNNTEHVAGVYGAMGGTILGNADLIIKAVNAHDKLVEACLAAKRLISQSSKIDWDDEVLPLLDDALEGLEPTP